MLESLSAENREKAAKNAAEKQAKARKAAVPVASKAPPKGSSVSLVDDSDVARQAEAMRSASASGAPFCKVCKKKPA
jgi:hypothetical protein